MKSELYYQLALTLVPNVGDVQAKILMKHFGNASLIFKAKRPELEKISGISAPAVKSLREFNEYDLVEKELKFIEKHKIKTLFLTDAEYPQRLLNCYDSPTLLFYKGTADLNASKVVSIVGTRNYTEYGKLFTEKLVQDLTDQNILVVSGLAYGIDSIAHRSALKNKIPTVGVVGHGLDMMYPPENAGMAKDMVKNGGVLSEFFSGTIPDKHNFPLRNRIVAGMADATLVIETLIKGGSMITAKLADSYNRDVFAVPGRASDKMSTGCNQLIKLNKAILLTDANDLLEVMGWKEKKKQNTRKQRELFVELTPEEQILVDLLREKETVHIDEINLKSELSSSAIAAAILNLELQNIITCLPGKMYKLL